MKKLSLVLFVGLLLVACKNDSKNAAAVQEETATQPEIVIDLAEVSKASEVAKTSLANMQQVLTEINTSISGLSKEQQSQLDDMRNELNDVISKQTQVVKGLEMTQASEGFESNEADMPEMPQPSVIQEYIQSANSYDQLVDETRKKFEALKSGKSKGN